MKQILTCTKKKKNQNILKYIYGKKVIAFNLIYGKLDTKSKQL